MLYDENMETKLDKMRLKLKKDSNLFFDLPSIAEKIKFLLRYAILAPSTHNTQPWIFRVNENYCEIKINPDLKLKYADQTDRDIHISIGCALENIVLAGKYYGLKEKIEYLEDGAKIFFDEKESKKDESYNNLKNTIIHRVNTRGGFTDQKIPSDFLRDLKDLLEKEYCTNNIEISLVEDKTKIKKIAELTMFGMKLAHSILPFRKEMSKWIVHNYTRRKEGMIGYSMNMPGPVSFFISPAVRFFNLGSIMGKINYKGVSSAPLIFVVSSPDKDPVIWIKVGQLAERAMLEFNMNGFNTSIYLASIEMGELFKGIQEITGLEKNRPQFLFATGKMKKIFKTSPRHEVIKKLV